MTAPPADNVTARLEWLRSLPPDGEKYDVMKVAGFTVDDLYAALDAAPVGTAILLRGGWPAVHCLATRTEAGWYCPTLPPAYGIYALGPYSTFWRGAGFDLTSITLPAS